MMSGGGSFGWWAPGALFMILCMVTMAWMMSHGHGSHRSHTGESKERASEVNRVLAERLAHGEIDVDEYERRLAALEGTGDVDRT